MTPSRPGVWSVVGFLCATIMACETKRQGDRGSDQATQVCPRSGQIGEQGRYLHGQTGIRRRIAEPLVWLKEQELTVDGSYRWVRVHERQAWSLSVAPREVGCEVEARACDGTICALSQASVHLQSYQCDFLTKCVTDARFFDQPSDSTSDAMYKVAQEGGSTTFTGVESREYYWFEGSRGGRYHIAIRDWSSGSNGIDACDDTWSQVVASLLYPDGGTVVP
jgi:hypothetical protein